MARSSNAPVKIDIIGGFLGAGKTTFINKLIADGLGGERVAIIENEFGQEAIDDTLIATDGFEMRTLASGCICCTLKVDFVRAIGDIVEQCKPDRIIIEPTGLAGPDELENTCNLATRGKAGANVRVNSMITIVDGTDVAEMIEYDIPVYLKQIEQAHLVVVSHAQELTPDQLQEAVEAIRGAAGRDVEVVTTPWDELDGLQVMALAEQAYAAQTEDAHDEHAQNDHSHEHGGHEHGHAGFSSALLFPTTYFDEAALVALGKALEAGGALRAKGFLPNASGQTIHYEFVNGRAQTSASPYAGPCKLVAIGRNLDVSTLPGFETN